MITLIRRKIDNVCLIRVIFDWFKFIRISIITFFRVYLLT